jgi:beta-glucosidase
VVSDWRAVHSEKVFASGLDLEMPGPGKFLNTKGVIHALEEGLLSEEDLNDKAERILRTIIAYGPNGAAAGQLDSEESRLAALAVAEESIVLLKNEGNLLPLDKNSLRKLLVIGPNASEARLGGGGSASVTPFYTVSPLQGIREICGPEVEVEFMEGCSLVGTMEPIHSCFTHKNSAGERAPGLLAEFFNTADPIGKSSSSWSVPQVDFSWGWASPGPGVQREIFSVRFSGWLTPPQSGKYRLGVYVQEGCVDFRINGEVAAEAWDQKNGNFEESYQTRYLEIERDLIEGQPIHIQLDYGKRAARAGLRLEWEVPGTSSPIEKAVQAAEQADAVIVCAGLSNLFEGGAHDRAGIDLPEAQQQLIRRVAEINPQTIVTLFNGGPLGVDWAENVPALLEAWYPGQEGGRALARILFGEINPSGRLPDTMAHQLSDHAAIRNYPGDGKTVTYEEGLHVGYRHFDAADITPRFPFGFGLSYTTFEIATPEASRRQIGVEDQLKITTTVSNTGTRTGKEVVQLYLRPLCPFPGQPLKELRTFRKIELLPGEETTVSFLLGRRELESLDPHSCTWQVVPGDYEVLVGSHSRSLKGVIISVR